ncbi:MAG: TolC family protein, partial [Psychroserpens sp.]|nr:TolC family protein [Psychroserpens sp.]
MRYLLGVILFLGFISFSFSQTKTYEIGYLLDQTSPEVGALLDTLSEEITAVVGEDAEIVFSSLSRQVNNFDKTKALQNYNNMVNSDVDIIIAFGVVNNAVISQIGTYEKPTIVFGTLSDELTETSAERSNISNYTSIITSQSYTEDLKLLKELANPDTVGFIVEQAFVDNLSIEETFTSIGEELELEIEFIPFQTLNDITSNLDGVDAVYLAGGFYLTNEEIRELADILIEKKLPSFTSNPVQDIKNGILANNYDQSELDQFFRRIALTVESVVNGEDLGNLSAKLITKRTLTINFNTAELIGLPLKYSLIATTSFIGDPNKTSADKIYNLVGVMQEAIEENLELQTFEQDIRLTDKELQFAKSDYLPNVTAGANGSYVDPDLAEVSNGQNPEIRTSGNIVLQQTIFSESANANISIQRSLRDAQQENYNSDALNTVFNTATAYFTALILKANLSIQNQNLELTKYNLKIAEENYEAGQSGKSDVLRFRSEMAQNTQQMVEAINQLEQGFYTLNQLLNNPIATKIDVEEAELKTGIFKNYNYEQLGQFLDDPKLREPFVDFLVQEALANAPELKAVQYNLDATERSERLFGAGRFLPTLAL